MIRCKKTKSDQRGATLLEFAIGATVLLIAMFGVIEFGRALWVHNALSDAARRAARYAVNQPASAPKAGVVVSGKNIGPSVTAIKNVAVYGNPVGGAQPLVNNLGVNNIDVEYTNFGVGDGTVSVSVINYQFQFVVPIIGTTIQMPSYNTTLMGENAGAVPDPL